MGSLFKYSGLATKVKAMQSHMLTNSDYNDMVYMDKVKDIALYLKNCPAYSDILADLDENDIHRGQIEKKLIFSMYKDYVKIYKFTSDKDRRFLNAYFIYFEIEIIKELLRMVLDSKTIEYDLRDFEKFFMEHSAIDIKKLSNSTDVNEFIECLKGTDYYNILSLLNKSEDITLFDIEMRLDVHYFTHTWKLRSKYLDKNNQKAISEALGAKIDLLNILWIYRAKRYYSIDKDIIYTYIIPIRYKLKKQQIINMIETKDKDELLVAIKNTYYSKILTNLDNNNAEKAYFTIVGGLLTKSKIQIPMSLAPVRYFMFYKETEIDNITKIIESIRYNLKPEEIMKYLDIYNKNRGVVI